MAFNIPNQTSYVLQRPVDPQSGWTRQPDWVTVTDTPGEVQFVVTNIGVSAYTINTVFSQTPFLENLYIDWGDGTIDTILTPGSTDTIHKYTTPGTPCSRGYDTYKVRIYVDSGARITGCRFGITSTQTNSGYPIGVLEAHFGDDTIIEPNQINFISSSSFYGTYPYLEYVKLPAVMNGTTAFDSTFQGCRVLSKVIMPVSAPNVANFNLTFFSCSMLQSIDIPSDATLATNFNGTFNGCVSLTGATLPTTMNNITTVSTMFSSCSSLSTIKLPQLQSCTNYSNMFNSCFSLITIEIPGFHSGTTTVTTTSMFQGCRSLEYVKFPTTVNSGNTFVPDSMFLGCNGLKSCIFPTNFNATTFSSTFNSCRSLSSVTLPTSMPSLTTMLSMFANCENLQEITLPTTVGATIDMNTTFSTCSALSEVIIPNSYNITSLGSTFQNCTNIRKIQLPNNTQNSLTTMQSMCNNCSNLQSIVLPTSMTGLTNMSTAFSNCINLESLTFPASLNSVTNMSNLVAGCFSLISVTLPTSMTSLTSIGISASFQNCPSLRTLVLPATVNPSISSYNSTCLGDTSLETLTLPTTQTTGVTTMAGLVNNCPALKTVNNIQFIGNPSTGATVYISGIDFSTGSYQFTGDADFYCKFLRLTMNGTATNQSLLSSLRLRNNGSGQYGGSSPQIDISYTSLSQVALIQVFTDLPTVTSKTINITGASGAASLTPANRAIATGKGWTITG